MICSCISDTTFTGVRALTYANEHLIKVRVNVEKREKEYVCPDTGQHWIMFYPHDELQGGGPPRLQAVDQKIQAAVFKTS